MITSKTERILALLLPLVTACPIKRPIFNGRTTDYEFWTFYNIRISSSTFRGGIKAVLTEVPIRPCYR